MGERTRVKGFVAHWGWIYVVFQMAEFYRESRNEQYDKSIIEFYNDLAFMKDKSKYDLDLAEERMRDAR